jgi:hypothetical protein
MKKLIFLSLGLLLVTSLPGLAQAGAPDIVIVKVSETQGSTQVVIVRGEGKSELLEMEGGSGSNAMTQSAKRVQQVLTKLYAQGYAVKSTFTGDHGSMSTLVLVKER